MGELGDHHSRKLLPPGTQGGGTSYQSLEATAFPGSWDHGGRNVSGELESWGDKEWLEMPFTEEREEEKYPGFSFPLTLQ